MSEKDANDNAYPVENGNNSEAAQGLPNEDDNAYSLKNGNNSEAAQGLPNEEDDASESLDSLLEGKCKKKENESLNLDSYLPPYESPLKKEDNPFSFKKFLNQDSSVQKNKGARKKIFTPANTNSPENSNLSNHRPNRIFGEMNSRISASDMSSVLPDFVQDHLVIEQCYLSGSSSDIDINNLNFQNLPDLNLEHRNVHFMSGNDGSTNRSSETLTDKLCSNLPDFTFGASNFQSVTKTISNNKRLPDFAVHPNSDIDDIELTTSRRTIEVNNDTSQSSRQRSQISSSPSVPLDLPSYENDDSSHNMPIPFDLTAPAEEKNSCRGMASNEPVSKSLPDFLSDGPIKKELDDNLQQNVRGIMQNGLPSDAASIRMEDRLHREIDFLRCQLMEKNRRVERLERELEHLHSTDQRETASLEYALQEVENNLKQTAKRALNAESMIMKLKQENKTLKSEISSLRSENVMLKLGNYNSQISPSEEIKNQKIAKELRSAAKHAEISLKSLLMGVDNLKALADTMENINKFQDSNKDIHDFSNEDSASGPAL